MKIRIGKVFIFVLILGMFCTNALAEETASTVTAARAASPLSFQISSNQIQIGTKDALADDIILKEAEAGLLKKGKVIYLSAENIKFENGAEVEVLSGDIKFKKVKTKDGVLALEIEKGSTVPSEIKITGLKLFLERDLPQGSYELLLITEGSSQYPNNLFGDSYGSDDETGKFDTKNITIKQDFVVLSDNAKAEEDFSGSATALTISIGEKEMLSENKLREDRMVLLDEPAYLSEKAAMLPLRGIAQELNPQSVVKWDGETNTVTILFGSRIAQITQGVKEMQINSTPVPMSKDMEIKNGRMFLSSEDLGIALGLSHIKYNQEEQSIYLK